MFLNNDQLLLELKSAVLEERKITLKVLALLKQVDNRKLYAEKGFDSLFSFTVNYLGYSESAAGRRVSAMRLLKELPEVEDKIISGELNLTSLTQAQSHFRSEAKTQPLLKEEKLELLKQLENKSTRDCEKIILAKSPEFIPQEKRRELTENTTELKTAIKEQVLHKLDRLKKLWGHKKFNMTDAELIEEMVEFCLDKVDPLRKEVKKEKSLPAPEVKQLSRYIPVNVKHKIWKRDNGKCQFVNKETGEVCESQKLIQIDHKYPYAFGGDHDPENLQLLCATHNKFRASNVFSWRPK